MTLLSRDAVLKSNDLKRKVVEVPEWGGSVLVREMTGAERDEYEASMVTEKEGGQDVRVNLAALRNLRARVVSWCAINEDGSRMFKPTDVQALGQKSAAALDRLYEAIVILSGIKEEELEVIEKNSG